MLDSVLDIIEGIANLLTFDKGSLGESGKGKTCKASKLQVGQVITTPSRIQRGAGRLRIIKVEKLKWGRDILLTVQDVNGQIENAAFPGRARIPVFDSM